MSAAAIPENSNSKSAAAQAAPLLACVLAAAWAGLGMFSAPGLSLLEIRNAAGLALAALLGLALFRGCAHMSASPAGRLWSAGIFCAGLLLLSHSFLRGTAAGLNSADGAAMRAQLFAPPFLALGLWLLTRFSSNTAAKHEDATDAAAQAERFLFSRSVRFNLALAGAGLAATGLAASGLPLRALPQRVLTVAALTLALKPLLQLSARPAATRALQAAIVAALGVSALLGLSRYQLLNEKTLAGGAALAADNPDAAKTAYSEADRLNTILCAQAPVLEMEESWARYYERQNAFWDAIERWNRVADLKKINRAEFLPLIRMQCKVGDSATIWRRLVYEGFASINSEQIAPGVRTMADLAANDVRAKLLAALLAWDQDESAEVRARRLREVQRVSPGEPSSLALLRRMGEPAPAAPMWIPDGLLVGSKPSLFSVLGTITELGEVQTLVMLDKGHWEMNINARGTPLREEWPVIRVELDGQPLGRTQINRAENHNAGFSFDIHRGNLYRLKIIFENRLEDMSDGRLSLRGLTINGIGMQHAPLSE
jgi:hypothetical protein